MEISETEYEELQNIKQKYNEITQNNTNQKVVSNIEELTQTINNLESIVKSFSKKIEILSEANNDITELVTVNDRISFQTNLLSINAKIEDSRAGEEGKGFAIVADEVKN
jgi:methyl-accepting chemotaxis protein